MSAPPELDFSKMHPLEVCVDGTSREDFEYAVRKFKTLFQRERVVGLLKEKSAFEKPSAKKRRKRREAQDRKLMTNMRDQLIKNGQWDIRQKKKAQKRIQKEEKSAEVRHV
jgi:ribosomal protein S21